jgi:hypothetical protein
LKLKIERDEGFCKKKIHTTLQRVGNKVCRKIPRNKKPNGSLNVSVEMVEREGG